MNRDAFIEENLVRATDRCVANLTKEEILDLAIPKCSRRIEFNSVKMLVEHLVEGKAQDDLIQEWEENKSERMVMDRL